MSLAFLLSTLIHSSQTAQTVGYAVILIGFVFQTILCKNQKTKKHRKKINK